MSRKLVTVPLKHSFSADAIPSEVPAFLPLLAGCLHFLDKLPDQRLVQHGRLLIEQGCTPAAMQLVTQGLVKLEHVSVHGRQTTIGLRSDGWYAGSVSALLGLPSIYSVRALTDCMVISIPGKELPQLFSACPEMLSHFFQSLCCEIASQASLNAELMSGSAEERLEHFMRERDRSRSMESFFDPLPLLKQMEIAQMLSITPEHLSRLMNRKRVHSTKPVLLRRREQRAASTRSATY